MEHPSLIQKAPEDELAKEMTHDLEMNFNKIAPFGKEDTAKELQDHAAKTQDTLVDAVENAEAASGTSLMLPHTGLSVMLDKTEFRNISSFSYRVLLC